jgi:hypothetical protein
MSLRSMYFISGFFNVLCLYIKQCEYLFVLFGRDHLRVIVTAGQILLMTSARRAHRL